MQGSGERLRRRARALANQRSRPEDTPLIRAVRAGDLGETDRLVRSGVDIDATNERGQTALHVAALLGRADIAAYLLTQGADYRLVDARNRTALALDHIDVETLHAIRQHYQRGRLPRSSAERNDDPTVARVVEELEARGIVRLGPVEDGVLEELRADFGGIIRELDAMVDVDETTDHNDREAYYWPEDQAYVTHNAFKHSATLARLSCSSPIADIARRYVGKPAFIQRAVGMRYLPEESGSHHMFRYHHDLVDRRLKVMILLTDVGDGDQFMSYVVGSHRLLHPYAMFRHNSCPLDYCERQLGPLEIFKTLGTAGEVFLFDSNGAHKGNRTPTGRTRDAFFVEFSAAATPQFGGDIPAEVFDDHPLVESNPLYVMANSPKRWEHPAGPRSGPTWIRDLPRPETWVWTAPRPPSG